MAQIAGAGHLNLGPRWATQKQSEAASVVLTASDSYNLIRRSPNMGNQYNKKTARASGRVLIASLLIAACGEDYTGPIDVVTGSACAYPVPEVERVAGGLVCNTGFASSDATVCYWPCANHEGVCGTAVVAGVGELDGYTISDALNVAPWCN